MSAPGKAGLPSMSLEAARLLRQGLQEQTYHGRTITRPEEVWEAAVSWYEKTKSLISGICNEDGDRWWEMQTLGRAGCLVCWLNKAWQARRKQPPRLLNAFQKNWG